MRWAELAACGGLIVGFALAIAPSASAVEAAIPAEHHAWGRFEPGAYSLVQTTIESVDAAGETENHAVVTTRTTLKQLDDDGVVLHIDANREIAGKRVHFDPRTIKQHFNGLVAGQDAVTTDGGTETVLLEGTNYLCQVQDIRITGSQTVTTIKLYYCPELPPYVVKSETTTTEQGSDKIVEHATMQVLATEMPYRVLSDILPTTLVEAYRETSQGSTRTLAIYAESIPGGLVGQLTKELDESGALVRQSVLELLDFGTHAPPRAAEATEPAPAP